MIASKYIFDTANSLVKQFNTRNPVTIAQETGVKIIRTDKFDKLLGMYTYQWQTRIMILNNRLGYYTEKMVAAHELGHDCLHRELAKDGFLREFTLLRQVDRTEYEANAFASHILLDSDEVYDCLRQGCSLEETAQIFCTDKNLLLIKLREMNKLGYKLPYIEDYDKNLFSNMPEEL